MLKAIILKTQAAITKWAMDQGFTERPSFRSYVQHHSPSEYHGEPIVTIMPVDEDIAYALYGYSDEAEESFSRALRALGLWFERYSSSVYHIYPDEGSSLWQQFEEYNRWEWICSLLKPDFDDVYEELYSFFIQCPDRLTTLKWRDFEILLQRVLTAQGFEAHLGPGTGDGGADIRVIQRDPLGDMLTLVQAKRYRFDRKINLEAVAALHGVARIEKAVKGIFVTTSSYLPSAKGFAARTNGELQLATSDDVLTWCKDATSGIVEDKSTLLAPSSVEKALARALSGEIPALHAHTGITMVTNEFALVLKESRHAALLMSLERQSLSDDGYGQRGIEVPVLDRTSVGRLSAAHVFRASRSDGENGPRYWARGNLYGRWDRTPQAFDYAD